MSTEEEVKLTKGQRNVLLTAQKKKFCEQRALKIVEILLEPGISPAWLLSQLVHISQEHYQDVTEERAAAGICGYPLCSQPLGAVPRKQYQISTISNRVYDITERKKFCSSACFRASQYLYKQLLTSPLWLRDSEPIPNFTLLQSDDNRRGLVGDPVNLGIAHVCRDDVNRPGNTSPVYARDVISDGLDEAAEQLDQLDLGWTSSSSESEASDEDQDSAASKPRRVRFRIDSKRGKPRRTKTVTGQVKIEEVKSDASVSKEGVASSSSVLGGAERSDGDGGHAETAATVHNSDAGSESKGGDGDSPDPCSEVKTGGTKVPSASAASNSSAPAVGSPNDTKTRRPVAGLAGRSGGVSGAVVSGGVRTRRTDQEDSDRAELSDSDEDVRVSLRKPAVLAAAVSSPPVDLFVSVETRLWHWIRPASTGNGQESTNTVPTTAQPGQNRSEPEQNRSEPETGLDTEREPLNTAVTSTTADSSIAECQPPADRRQAQRENQRLQAFLRGQLKIVERPVEQKQGSAGPEDQDGVPLQMPLVDSVEQGKIRRQIVTQQLNKRVAGLLHPIGLVWTDVTSQLRQLIATFHLTSDNVTLAPKQWSLISLVLLRILLRHHDELSRLARDVDRFFSTSLSAFEVTPARVDQLVDQLLPHLTRSS